MLVVGIMGRAGAGKSAVAEHLIRSADFRRAKFAAALKEMLRTLLRYRGVDPDTIERMVEGDLKEISTPHLNGKSPRHAMLTLGTEWGRNLIDADLWVDTETDMVRRCAPSDRILFDDVRFENEARSIRAMGGRIIRVDRPGQTVAIDHESERLDIVPDAIIRNTRDLAFLATQVDAFVSPLIENEAA